MSGLDPTIALAGLCVGILVGLTGMGGGALMTPVLVFFFKVDPLTAVSSDVVSSLFMKPAGAVVHLVRRTANLQLAGWLCVGSVPAAFLGAYLVHRLQVLANFEAVLKSALGVALLVAAAGLVVRAWFGMVRRHTPFGEGPAPMRNAPVVVRPWPTAVLGALGGLTVGMTSVGAGSLIITFLLLLYPRLKVSELVGTDLVQAIPLVASASVGHLIFGSVSFGVTGSVLVGAIPGAFLGAQLSSRAPGGIIRRALAILLLASGLQLVGLPTPVVVGSAVAAIVLGNLAWILLRRRLAAREVVPPVPDERLPSPTRPTRAVDGSCSTQDQPDENPLVRKVGGTGSE